MDHTLRDIVIHILYGFISNGCVVCITEMARASGFAIIARNVL
jgi:hypothetical protein